MDSAKPGHLEMLSASATATTTTGSLAGLFSAATKVNFGEFSMIYTSGQLGIDRSTGELISDDVEEQTKQAIENLKAVLENNGSSLNNITRCNLFLVDMADFGKVNEIYKTFFTEHLPARTAIAVHQLPKAGKFEIQADATVKN